MNNTLSNVVLSSILFVLLLRLRLELRDLLLLSFPLLLDPLLFILLLFESSADDVADDELRSLGLAVFGRERAVLGRGGRSVVLVSRGDFFDLPELFDELKLRDRLPLRDLAPLPYSIFDDLLESRDCLELSLLDNELLLESLLELRLPCPFRPFFFFDDFLPPVRLRPAPFSNETERLERSLDFDLRSDDLEPLLVSLG